MFSYVKFVNFFNVLDESGLVDDCYMFIMDINQFIVFVNVVGMENLLYEVRNKIVVLDNKDNMLLEQEFRLVDMIVYKY